MSVRFVRLLSIVCLEGAGGRSPKKRGRVVSPLRQVDLVNSRLEESLPQFQRKWNLPMGRTVRVLVISVWFFAGMCVAQSAAKQPQLVPRQVNLGRVLSWLPADTEVVIGARGPFRFPDLAAIPPPSSRARSP